MPRNSNAPRAAYPAEGIGPGSFRAARKPERRQGGLEGIPVEDPPKPSETQASQGGSRKRLERRRNKYLYRWPGDRGGSRGHTRNHDGGKSSMQCVADRHRAAHGLPVPPRGSRGGCQPGGRCRSAIDRAILRAPLVHQNEYDLRSPSRWSEGRLQKSTA
jgi:hypothetical protein